MKRCALPLALVLAVLLPAEAIADIRYRGKSGQGRLVTLRTGDDRVLKRFGIKWRARCREPGFVYAGGTVFLPPFDSVTRTRFVDAGEYRVRLGRRERSVLRVRIAGNRSGLLRWRGIFRARIRVFRGNRLIDRCYVRTRWRVRVA